MRFINEKDNRTKSYGYLEVKIDGIFFVTITFKSH